VAERAQRAATEENRDRQNTSKLRNIHQFDNTCAANNHNATKYRNVLQIAQTTLQMFLKE